jgi:uncharacterized protein YbjQ (UPF0145 family)
VDWSGFYTSKYILDGRLKKLTRELSPSRLGFVTLEEHTKQQGAEKMINLRLPCHRALPNTNQSPPWSLDQGLENQIV